MASFAVYSGILGFPENFCMFINYAECSPEKLTDWSDSGNQPKMSQPYRVVVGKRLPENECAALFSNMSYSQEDGKKILIITVENQTPSLHKGLNKGFIFPKTAEKECNSFTEGKIENAIKDLRNSRDYLALENRLQPTNRIFKTTTITPDSVTNYTDVDSKEMKIPIENKKNTD